MKAIDTNTVITPDIAKQLKSAGIEAVGRYINRISQDEIDTVHKAGQGIFFYYETNPTYPGYFTPQQGIHDAQDAIQYAHKLNIPALVPIACTVDLDVSNAELSAVNAYVQAYRAHLQEYLDGLYGKYDVVSQIEATKKIQTYAWSGGNVYTANSAYQHQNDVTLAGIQVDLVDIQDEKIVWFGGNPMSRLLMIGAQGPDVKVLQSELNRTGAQLVVDGDFGPATQAAVKVFQKDHGLNPDGVVGPLTYAALDKALAPKPIPTPQKPQQPPQPPAQPVTHNYTMVLTLADSQVAGTWAYLYVKTLDNGQPFAADGITINENGSDLVTHAKTDATSGEFMWAISESTEKTDIITVTWTDPAGVAHKIVHDTKFYVPQSSATPVPSDDSAVVTIPMLPQSDAMDAVFFNITAPNGKDVLVQLDTGAFMLMFNKDAEDVLGLQKGMALTVTGVGGQNTAYYSSVTFSIQSVEFKDVQCVIDESYTGTPLFGYKFFVDNGYDLLVSQKHNTITICK